MTPIKWLFRDEELIRKEKELDDHLERIKKRVINKGSSMLLEIDTDFPHQFTELSNRISKGNIQWRDFYCNKTMSMYGVHCRMAKGSLLREHRHPKYDEYLYVISGSIINWMDADSEGYIISPVEEAIHDDNESRAWYTIPAGTSHRIQALENHTHFISKFMKPDV